MHRADQGGGKNEYFEFLNGAKEQGFLNNMKVYMDDVSVEIDATDAVVEGVKLSSAFGDLTMDFKFEQHDEKWVITYSAQH